jgi:hypothetical protein
VEPWENGILANLEQAVDLTLQRVLQSIVVEGTDLAQDIQDKGLVAKFVMCLDPSGNHAVYNTSSILAEGVDTTHIIVVGFSLISIKIDEPDGEVVYLDKNYSCSEAQRPLGLIPDKKTRETCGKLLVALDIAVDPIHSQPMFIACCDFNASVKADIGLTQLDGKMYCTVCTVSRDDAHKPERIEQGFEINRTIENTWQLYMELKDECANVPVSLRDYQRRTGLTHHPLL